MPRLGSTALPNRCNRAYRADPSPLASREEIEANELVETEFIMREPGSGAYDTLYPQLAQFGIALESLNILMTLGNSEAIVLAVKEGLGVAFISRIVIESLDRKASHQSE